MFKKTLIISFYLFLSLSSFAQVVIDNQQIEYLDPKEFEIGGITVTGPKYLDEGVLISLSGLSVGDKIVVPGEKISKAIENLWKQGLFADVKIAASKIQGKFIFLNFQLVEKPRLSKFSFKGVSKSDADKIREKIKLVQGKVVTENILTTSVNQIKEYYAEKGFLDAEVKIDEKKDTTLQNSVLLVINVNKKKRVKINKITFSGNKELSDRKLKRSMKDTKEKHWYRLFSTSKFLEENFTADKAKIIEKYNSKGFRDAKIEKDSVSRHGKRTLNIDVNLFEGHKYYFRNITWVGNTKYPTEELSNILGIKKGDIYDQATLDARLFMSPTGRDISTLYLDNGYLFFRVDPVETKVENDSIDIEMRIFEGKQATVNKVTVTGNTKTNDRVIRREIRTKPGELFSKSDIVRTQRELAQLGYFNPEKMNVLPKPNPTEGTVDIEYVLEEKSSDQVELSGGYGNGIIIGTLGVSFNNFSARKFFSADAWKRGIPAGDGQRLSLRIQSNGSYYQSYNASFVEPWLGGKKPISLSVSAFYSIYSNSLYTSDAAQSALYTIGGAVGIGKRLKFPDDFFTLFHEVSYQNYRLKNYNLNIGFSNGTSNNINFTETLSRNSIDQPIYPRTGSIFSLSAQLTPPFSILTNKDLSDPNLAPQDRYKFVEYHKWKFNAEWYSTIIGKERPLVLRAKARFGFLGSYNPNSETLFERFFLGGDGLSGGFNFAGRDIIALRGYENFALTPTLGGLRNYFGGTAFDKFILELRYPISLNPNATIYALTFAEAGNAWMKVREFNPFEAKRSIGAGLRVFLPMLGGLLGIDYGYGLDAIPNLPDANQGQFHFSIGASMD